MSMSPAVLAQGAALLETVLLDQVQILNVGDPVTVGHEVTREVSNVGEPVRGLVQSVTLENAVESRVSQAYSVKVARATALVPGQAVKVLSCQAEPELVGKIIYIDKVSLNGLAMLRKGTGSDFENVNQEGKGEL